METDQLVQPTSFRSAFWKSHDETGGLIFSNKSCWMVCQSRRIISNSFLPEDRRQSKTLVFVETQTSCEYLASRFRAPYIHGYVRKTLLYHSSSISELSRSKEERRPWTDFKQMTKKFYFARTCFPVVWKSGMSPESSISSFPHLFMEGLTT